MAVAPTGAIYKALEFDGVSSRTYGVYITGEAVYNAPARDVEMITIPGRNGTYALDRGRFENIEVSYPAGIFAETEADFREAISDFRNFLCSHKGYVRLQDEYNPDEYRMAVYKSGLEVDPAMLRAGDFNIVFDCKPQRYLTSGEEPITIGEWKDTETVTGDIVEVENPDGILGVKSLSVALAPIQDLHGYDKPWSGGNGKNKLPNVYSSGSSYTTNGITYTNNDGVVKVSGTPTGNAYYILFPNTDGQRLPLKAGTYTISCAETTANCKVNFTVVGVISSVLNATQHSYTFTASTDAEMYANILTDGSSAVNLSLRIQIESGSTATSYAPYSNICPISGRTECEVVREADWHLASSYTGDGYVANSYLDNTGAIHQGTNNFVSGYFPISANTPYKAVIEASLNSPSICFYDSNKTFISGVKYQYRRTFTGTTPNGTAFARMCYTSGYTQVMGVWGNVLTIPVTWQTEAGTVYGGTLDVVSGVLTVTKVYALLNDASKWVTSSGTINFLYNVEFSDRKQYTDSYSGLISSYVPIDSMESTYGRWQGANIDRFGIRSNDATLAQIKADATAGNIAICYELATPQTYQLSGQDIALLKGTNNVWSDSGEITLEYGQLPNLLINPTLFEASPLLEIEGYGDIDFNGFNISLEDGSYGRITLLENNDFRPLTPTNPFVYTQKFDRRYVAVGDELTLNGWQESVGQVKFYGVAYLKGNFGFDSSTYRPDVRSSEWSYISNNIQNVGVARKTSYPSYLIMTATVNPLNLYVGTPSTFNADATFTFPIIQTSDDIPTGQNAQITLSIEIDYDGNDTITITFNRTVDNDPYSIFEGIVNDPEDSSYWNRLKLSSVIADSTETYLGHPTYVDCDLGEAYKIENHEVISLNAYIDLGSKLPELSPGSNEITFDNTINDLKVVPRWWKV